MAQLSMGPSGSPFDAVESSLGSRWFSKPVLFLKVSEGLRAQADFILGLQTFEPHSKGPAKDPGKGPAGHKKKRARRGRLVPVIAPWFAYCLCSFSASPSLCTFVPLVCKLTPRHKPIRLSLRSSTRSLRA
jgi:hypothetical protein